MKLTPDKVYIAIKAYAGGLTIKEIAIDFLKVSERTFYYWIAQGRNNYIRVNMVEIRKDELSFTDQLKLELFEGMKAEGYRETRDELLERLENRINEIGFEQGEEADAPERGHNNPNLRGKKNLRQSKVSVNALRELRIFPDSVEMMDERRRKRRFKPRRT